MKRLKRTLFWYAIGFLITLLLWMTFNANAQPAVRCNQKDLKRADGFVCIYKPAKPAGVKFCQNRNKHLNFSNQEKKGKRVICTYTPALPLPDGWRGLN